MTFAKAVWRRASQSSIANGARFIEFIININGFIYRNEASRISGMRFIPDDNVMSSGLTIARTDVSSLYSGNIFSFYSSASECRLRHEHMVPPAPRVEFTDYNVSSSGTSVMIMYNMLNSWYKLIWPSTRTDDSMASRCHSVQMEHGQFEIIRKSKKIQLNFFSHQSWISSKMESCLNWHFRYFKNMFVKQ